MDKIALCEIGISDIPHTLGDKMLKCTSCGYSNFRTGFYAYLDSEITRCKSEVSCSRRNVLSDPQRPINIEKLRFSKQPRKGYSLKELKGFCRRFKLKVSGRKVDVVKRLLDHLNGQLI